MDNGNAAPPKRKAWKYTQSSALNLKALATDKDSRSKFYKYLKQELPIDAFDLAIHFTLRTIPSDAVSRFGAFLGRRLMPRYYPVATARATRSIARICPELSAHEKDRLLIANQEAQGRIMTEFSILPRIINDRKRVQRVDEHYVIEAKKAGPLILIGMHLGNWEIGPDIMRDLGITPYAVTAPPTTRAKQWISTRIRKKMGAELLPAGLDGLRPALKVLQSGGTVSIFCDEGFRGKIRAPFFDCEPHLECNYALAARLARLTSAKIVPWYGTRKKDFNFTFRALPPIQLGAYEKGPEQLLKDVTTINSVIEPVVREHLNEWYFLDSDLRPPKASSQMT